MQLKFSSRSASSENSTMPSFFIKTNRQKGREARKSKIPESANQSNIENLPEWHIDDDSDGSISLFADSISGMLGVPNMTGEAICTPRTPSKRTAALLSDRTNVEKSSVSLAPVSSNKIDRQRQQSIQAHTMETALAHHNSTISTSFQE